MTLTFGHSITAPTNFLNESFSSSEWERELKPGTSIPYESVNHLDPDGDRSAHWGYDLRGAYGDPIFAGVDGRVMWDNTHPSLGNVVIVRDFESGLWLWSAHTSWRIASGTIVQPKTMVARIGTSGGVKPHLHFTCTDERGYCYFHDPGPALRGLQEDLIMADISKEQEDRIVNRVATVVVDRLQQTAELLITGNKRPMFPTGAAYVEAAKTANLKTIKDEP